MNPESSAQALLDRAAELLDAGRFDDALAQYSEVLASDPDNHEAHLMAGSIHGESGRLYDAVRHLRRAVELRPNDAASRLALAQVLRAQTGAAAALATLQAGVAAGIDDVEMHCALAALLAEAGQLPAAADAAERAVDADPGNVQAWQLLVSLLRNIGANERLVPACRSLLTLQPADSDTLLALADALLGLGRFAEAEHVLIPAAQQFADNPQIQLKAAIALSKQGRHGEALPFSTRAWQALPDSAQAQAHHFDILEKRGDHEPALEVIRPLLESDAPPLWAVLAFVKISPVFGAVDDAGQLLNRVAKGRPLAAVEQDAVREARIFLEKSKGQ